MDVINQIIKKHYAIYHGDCVEIIKGIPDESIHYSIFSPPFLSLFTYSNSDRDMGNCKKEKDFLIHFQFLAKSLFRVMKTGRLVSIHCSDVPAMKERDGFIGLKDFPAMVRKIFEKAGFIYHSKVVIWKDPLIEAVRTKSIGLMHKQIEKDSSRCRQGLPDYIITMVKYGENKEPVSHKGGFKNYYGEKEPKEVGVKYSHNVWRKYASPIWMDINQTNTLNTIMARDKKDERHICLAKGSLILTKRGFIEIQNVEIGDETLTHKGNWKPIIAKECTGINPVIKTHAQGVPELITTLNHKLWTRQVTTIKPKQSMKSHDPIWVEAQNIKGNYVNLKLPSIIDSKFSEIEWWLIGRYLADGHVGGHERLGMKSFYISVGKNKIDYFLSKVSEFVGASQKSGENCIQYRLKNLSLDLRRLLWDKCGHKAIEKQVPFEGLCLDKNKSEALISGYLSGDGHQDKFGRWHCCSISRGLLLGMAMVAQRARHVIPSIYKGKKEQRRKIEGRLINQKQLWIMTFNDNAKYTFSEILDDGAWKKTRKIENKGKEETWSIQVSEDASFTAEGCLVKNCPLQLDVIARCLTLWSNENDVVLSPFMGIGSEGYEALKQNRKFIGIELKDSYFREASKNLKTIKNKIGFFNEEK